MLLFGVQQSQLLIPRVSPEIAGAFYVLLKNHSRCVALAFVLENFSHWVIDVFGLHFIPELYMA